MSEAPQPSEPSVPAEIRKPDERTGATQYYQQVNVHFNLGQILPDPDKLHKYPTKMVDAMIEMARDEQKFRHVAISKDLDYSMRFDRRAQIFTLISYVLLFSLGSVCVLFNHPYFGGTLVGATFLTAIGSSFFNRGTQTTSEATQEAPVEGEPPPN